MRKIRISPNVKRTLRFGLPVVIFLAIVFFLVKDWQSEWQELMTKQLQFNPWLLGCAFVGFLLQELSYGLIWRSVLQRLGYRPSLRICLRIYLSSEFVRYIPGNVWHVITRMLWISKYGVSRSEAFASMVIELVTKIVAGILVFTFSIIFWGNVGTISNLVHGQQVFIFVGIAGTVMMLICVHPKALNGMLSFALRIVKKDPIALKMHYGDILCLLLAWCASWIIAGCAFFFLLWSIWPTAPLTLLPVCIGLYALAWDVGFASFITPSGLGIREGVIAAIFGLVFPLPAGLAGIIAILSRLISTVAELLCVGVAYLGGARQVRAIQREQLQHPEI